MDFTLINKSYRRFWDKTVENAAYLESVTKLFSAKNVVTRYVFFNMIRKIENNQPKKYSESSIRKLNETKK